MLGNLDGYRQTCGALGLVVLGVLLPAAGGASRDPAGRRAAPPDPPARVGTLEDIYGDTGDNFQAAIGIINFEKPYSGAPDPIAGYGLGVDDVLFQWREFDLVPDATDCALTGTCATVGLTTTNLFGGDSMITITVIDSSPTDNDCNGDGDTTDIGVCDNDPETICTDSGECAGGTCGVDPFFADDRDCNDNGTPDVVITATSEVEIPGERLVLDSVGIPPDEYRGDLVVSATADIDGVLFLQRQGNDLPTVTVTYLDLDDGTGQVCQNDVDPASWGRIETATTVFYTTGRFVVTGIRLHDNGDDDGWADTNETVEMQIRVSNKTGVPLSNVSARLATADPKIDCILDSFAAIGDMAVGEEATAADVFAFRVADVDREAMGLGPLDELTASFTVLLSADGVGSSTSPQTVILELDLDAQGGESPTTFFESFEVAEGFGTFTTMNLDAGRNNFSDSDGFRCQYSDPDWHNSNSYAQITDCYVAATPTQAEAYFWQINEAGESPDGGRSYSGTRSLYMGVYGPAPDENTTPLAALEAIRTQDPINLGYSDVCEVTRTAACNSDADCASHCVADVCTLSGDACSGPPDCPDETCVAVQPELRFKHQAAIGWERISGESGDRGAVAVQLADAGGAGVGHWIKIYPYENVYDLQGVDNFTNCLFDPVDDGNNEDDFFDPADPDRRLGPSTLCFPELIFGNLGDTDAPFQSGNVGNASDPPGLEGETGPGTWVQSRFSLDRFRGRRLRVRFVNSALKAGSFETWESLFSWNPISTDDGWYIDDVEVLDGLDLPATLTNDIKDNTSLETCGVTCDSVTATLTADPPGALPAPGQLVELDASTSFAERCLDGALQYRYSIDGDGNGVGGDPADTLLRGWTLSPGYVDAPIASTRYVVDVRCSEDPTCADSAAVDIDVSCPSSGNLSVPFPEEMLAQSSSTFGWSTATDAEYIWGDLANVPALSPLGGEALGPTTSFSHPATPTPTAGFWYLVRDPGRYCNDIGLWSTGAAGEVPGRDGASGP